MGRVAAARRIAVAAAYGGGGISALGAGAYGLLLVESRLARRIIPSADALPPPSDGDYPPPAGVASVGPPLQLVMLGDSSGAGFGAALASETPGAVIAHGLAAASGRTVSLRVLATVGAQSGDLDGQVAAATTRPVDAALIMIGANDVTHRVRPATAVRLLGDAVRRLREAGSEVVVGTCPDLGTIEPIAQPLRAVARRLSRQLAAAQTIAVVEAGGRSVSLGDLLGPEFAARPREMFAADRFHPSAAGYHAAAGSLLPSMCAALGVGQGDDAPDLRRGEGLRSIAEAAVEAAETAGTEVSASPLAGHARGPRGLWALLRHRTSRTEPSVLVAPPEQQRV